MALELYYTSSPRGLRPGASGLCTVAMTRSMSASLAARLESLCGYRPPAEDVPMDRWPVAMSHWIVEVGGVERHVLASVRPVQPDHTMRSNTLAHFAVLHNSELDPAGAAWMLAQPETLASHWTGEPRALDSERAMPGGGPAGPRRCASWQSVAGDAGWAGVIANAAVLDPSKSATIIYPLGTRVLDLVGEAMALVPAPYRWRVTFSTYFTQPMAGLRCTWRFCLDGTSAANAARQGGGLVIDMCAPQPCTRTGAFIDAARSGREPVLGSPEAASTGASRQAVRRQASGDAVATAEVGQAAAPHSRRRMPIRLPVGVDEPSPAHASTGRTALAASVVTSVALLATVAVLAVLLRMMGLEVRDLEARLGTLRSEADEARAAAEASVGLGDEVERLKQALQSATDGRDQLEARLRDERQSLDGLRERIRELESQNSVTPQTQPPQDMPRQSPESMQPSDHSAASVRAEGGRTIGNVRMPDRGSLVDQTFALDWPELSACGATSLSLVPSAALGACGFAAREPGVLAFRLGDSLVDVARVNVEGTGATWTWLKGSAERISRQLQSSGLELPNGWPAILGQLQLRATCADATEWVANVAPPASRPWRLSGSRAQNLEIPISRALAIRPTLEWGGRSAVMLDGSPATAAVESGAGTVSARLVRAATSRDMLVVTLDWAPSELATQVMVCIDEIEASLAAEREVSALYAGVSRWVDWLDRHPGASPLSPEELGAIEKRFASWMSKRTSELGSAASAFAVQPLETRAAQYRRWIWESELKPIRDSLMEQRGICEGRHKQLADALRGSSALIRPEPSAPAVAQVTLMWDRRVPELPFASALTSGKAAP